MNVAGQRGEKLESSLMALADKQYKPKRTLHSMNSEFVQFVAFLSTPLTVNKIRIESNYNP